MTKRQDSQKEQEQEKVLVSRQENEVQEIGGRVGVVVEKQQNKMAVIHALAQKRTAGPKAEINNLN